MKQINVYNFYQLGIYVHPLAELEAGRPLKDYLFALMLGRVWLSSLVKDEFLPMTICRHAARKTLSAIDKIVPPDRDEYAKVDFEKVTTASDLYYVLEGAKEFETVFSAELQNIATYFVSKKGIYDTNDLISRADDLFTEKVRSYMPEQAIQDVREAGRCLAFDLATAAGFHIARAVEGVLLGYLGLLCPDKIADIKEAQRNLGAYIKIARDNKGDEKVCGALDQFRDLHRNPLIHPESVLSTDEAVTLVGIAQSAIVAMALDSAKRTTPTLPLL